MGRSLPLSRYPIVSTTRDDEAERLISRAIMPARFIRISEPWRFRLDMNGRRLGRFFFGFNKFASETLVEAGKAEGIVGVALGHEPSRPSYFELDGERIEMSDATGAVISPTRRARIRRPGGSGLFALSIPVSVLADRYEEITGQTLRDPIVFNPSVDLTKGPGRLLREAARELAAQIEGDRPGSESPVLWSALEDAIISFILGLPGTHSRGLFKAPRRAPAPGIVRRAEEYLAAHAADPVTVSDLVAMCGCSRSTIFQAFKSSRGYTPMQFLAARRLGLARDRLMNQPRATATEVALDCGFGNLGRFAKAYRERFGVLPSETHAQRHGHRRS